MGSAGFCALLALPLELRLEIYSFAVLNDPPAIMTLGIAKVEGRPSDTLHRRYTEEGSPLPDTPEWYEPVIKSGYDQTLLNPAMLATVTGSPQTEDSVDRTRQPPLTSYASLMLVNRQCRAELQERITRPTQRRTSLFVQFPHGLRILRKCFPGLIKRARSIHLAGVYEPSHFDPNVGARLRQGRPEEQPTSTLDLQYLLQNHFAELEKFEMRIHFPGRSANNTTWGDDDSPVAVALRCLGPGEIGLEILRGLGGNGVILAGRPRQMQSRHLTTKWSRLGENRLDEDGSGRPSDGSWITNCDWPAWDTVCLASDGEHNRISFPV